LKAEAKSAKLKAERPKKRALGFQLFAYICGMATTKLTINSNGSVKIDGDFEIVDMQGNNYGLQGRTIVSICRCGLSNNKPFCDGSHKGHFEHDAQAFDLPPKKV
jgi:CDGSH-type Zn-finger protein